MKILTIEYDDPSGSSSNTTTETYGSFTNRKMMNTA